MENSFEINYDGKAIKVDKQDANNYIAHLPANDVHIHLQKDNDGANRWLEKDKEHETKTTKKIGAAIEVYQADHNKL